MKAIPFLVILFILSAASSVRAGTVFEISDSVKLGVRPLYSLVFADYGSEYRNAPGAAIGVQKAFQFNAGNKLLLYPEFGFAFYYLQHKSESGRRLMLFPFTLNLFFDITALNFETKAGVFTLKPYIGLGAYLNSYKSGRTGATACDFGYQAGLSLEYTHTAMKDFYVEFRVNHMGTTNFTELLPALDFGLGFGYNFATGRSAADIKGGGR